LTPRHRLGTLRAWMTAMRGPGRSVLPARRDAAVLLLHGLTGTPVDMHYMKDALVAEGYTVSSPLLPGRGTRPEDMFSLCWEDWMSAARPLSRTPFPTGSSRSTTHETSRRVLAGR